MSSILPARITRMVVELHRRGYTSLYLYSGMSASGMNWRFTIGNMVDKKWPTSDVIITSSIRSEDEVSWANDNTTAEALADGFESHFCDKIKGTKSIPTEYLCWFDLIVGAFKDNECLIFYADYSARHEHLLKSAPGFNGKKNS